MGISKLFKEKSGAPFVETAPGGITAAGDNKRGAPGGGEPAAGQDNVANEANFEDEHGNWVLTEAEAWKLAAALAAAKDDEEFQAALSGILAGRIFENYFDKNEINQKTAREKDQKARADMYYMAILQAQIEALDAQIADLTNKIDNFEGKHFTADEQAYFDSLPPEDRFTAKDKAMQARLAAGEITQDEYDRWNGWYADRAQAQQDQDRIKNIMANGTVQEIERVARNEKIDAVREARDILGAPMKSKVENTLEQRDDGGNVTLKNSNAEERFLTGGGNALGGSALSGGTSMASALTGGSALAGKTPPVKSAFVQATGPVEQTTLALQPENDKPQDPAHGGPPVGLG